MNAKISNASHPKTNEVIYSLITRNISDTSMVLDFGAGQGYMSQKVGGYFSNLDKPPKIIFMLVISPRNFLNIVALIAKKYPPPQKFLLKTILLI